MPLFNFHIMVDWSGADRRCSGRNSIWIAHAAARANAPHSENPRSRTDAVRTIAKLLAPFASGNNGRALVCFDFPYGYPRGFAKCLPELKPQQPSQLWRRVWEYLSANIQDDLGTKPSRVASNKSNRFAVAGGLNQLLSPPGRPLGPFWCQHTAGRYPHIPQNEPNMPFITQQGNAVERLRFADDAVKGDFPFRLFGNGSVGSQLLLGIPRLAQLRYSPTLSCASAVWPFETGWAPEIGDWQLGDQRIVHAEIFPTVVGRFPGPIPDRAQVAALWSWARGKDLNDELQLHFALPTGIVAGSSQDIAIRHEEGWILH